MPPAHPSSPTTPALAQPRLVVMSTTAAEAAANAPDRNIIVHAWELPDAASSSPAPATGKLASSRHHKKTTHGSAVSKMTASNTGSGGVRSSTSSSRSTLNEAPAPPPSPLSGRPEHPPGYIEISKDADRTHLSPTSTLQQPPRRDNSAGGGGISSTPDSHARQGPVMVNDSAAMMPRRRSLNDTGPVSVGVPIPADKNHTLPSSGGGRSWTTNHGNNSPRDNERRRSSDHGHRGGGGHHHARTNNRPRRRSRFFDDEFDVDEHPDLREGLHSPTRTAPISAAVLPPPPPLGPFTPTDDRRRSADTASGRPDSACSNGRSHRSSGGRWSPDAVFEGGGSAPRRTSAGAAGTSEDSGSRRSEDSGFRIRGAAAAAANLSSSLGSSPSKRSITTDRDGSIHVTLRIDSIGDQNTSDGVLGAAAGSSGGRPQRNDHKGLFEKIPLPQQQQQTVAVGGDQRRSVFHRLGPKESSTTTPPVTDHSSKPDPRLKKQQQQQSKTSPGQSPKMRPNQNSSNNRSSAPVPSMSKPAHSQPTVVVREFEKVMSWADEVEEEERRLSPTTTEAEKVVRTLSDIEIVTGSWADEV